MDWDKLKVFHAAAEAGSFTHAGEQLGLSQSAVSRQVSALEQELAVSLFHRHARGLILTEQGELLYRTAHDVFMKLEAARAKLTDSREKPNGELKVTTTPGIGIHWLTPRLGEFLDLFPDIRVTLITTDEELDLAMREADVAIRLRQPTQPDLIQRKLFSVHFHAYASPEYLKRFGTPKSLADLDFTFVKNVQVDDGTMFDNLLREETITLAPGDLVVWFTDGISETMNEAFDCFGESRLAQVVEQYAHLPFDQLRSYILAELRAFAGGADQHDDMTMILLKIEATTGAAA